MRQAIFKISEQPEFMPSPLQVLQAIRDSAAAASACPGYDWILARDVAHVRRLLTEQRSEPGIILCFEGMGEPLNEKYGVELWRFAASVQQQPATNEGVDVDAAGMATLETVCALERFLRSVRFRSSLIRPEGVCPGISQWISDEAGEVTCHRLSFDLPVAPPIVQEVTINLPAYMAESINNH